jgi:hypothetical protein
LDHGEDKSVMVIMGGKALESDPDLITELESSDGESETDTPHEPKKTEVAALPHNEDAENGVPVTEAPSSPAATSTTFELTLGSFEEVSPLSSQESPTGVAVEQMMKLPMGGETKQKRRVTSDEKYSSGSVCPRSRSGERTKRHRSEERRGSKDGERQGRTYVESEVKRKFSRDGISQSEHGWTANGQRPHNSRDFTQSEDNHENISKYRRASERNLSGIKSKPRMSNEVQRPHSSRDFSQSEHIHRKISKYRPASERNLTANGQRPHSIRDFSQIEDIHGKISKYRPASERNLIGIKSKPRMSNEVQSGRRSRSTEKTLSRRRFKDEARVDERRGEDYQVKEMKSRSRSRDISFARSRSGDGIANGSLGSKEAYQGKERKPHVTKSPDRWRARSKDRLHSRSSSNNKGRSGKGYSQRKDQDRDNTKSPGSSRTKSKDRLLNRVRARDGGEYNNSNVDKESAESDNMPRCRQRSERRSEDEQQDNPDATRQGDEQSNSSDGGHNSESQKAKESLADNVQGVQLQFGGTALEVVEVNFDEKETDITPLHLEDQQECQDNPLDGTQNSDQSEAKRRKGASTFHGMSRRLFERSSSKSQIVSPEKSSSSSTKLHDGVADRVFERSSSISNLAARAIMYATTGKTKKTGSTSHPENIKTDSQTDTDCTTKSAEIAPFEKCDENTLGMLDSASEARATDELERLSTLASIALATKEEGKLLGDSREAICNNRTVTKKDEKGASHSKEPKSRVVESESSNSDGLYVCGVEKCAESPSEIPIVKDRDEKIGDARKVKFSPKKPNCDGSDERSVEALEDNRGKSPKLSKWKTLNLDLSTLGTSDSNVDDKSELVKSPRPSGSRRADSRQPSVSDQGGGTCTRKVSKWTGLKEGTAFIKETKKRSSNSRRRRNNEDQAGESTSVRHTSPTSGPTTSTRTSGSSNFGSKKESRSANLRAGVQDPSSQTDSLYSARQATSVHTSERGSGNQEGSKWAALRDNVQQSSPDGSALPDSSRQPDSDRNNPDRDTASKWKGLRHSTAFIKQSEKRASETRRRRRDGGKVGQADPSRKGAGGSAESSTPQRSTWSALREKVATHSDAKAVPKLSSDKDEPSNREARIFCDERVRNNTDAAGDVGKIQSREMGTVTIVDAAEEKDVFPEVNQTRAPLAADAELNNRSIDEGNGRGDKHSLSGERRDPSSSPAHMSSRPPVMTDPGNKHGTALAHEAATTGGASRWNDLKARVATGKDSNQTAEKTVQDTARRSKRVSKWDALRRGTEFIAETERRSKSGSRRRRTRELATELDIASTGNETALAHEAPPADGASRWNDLKAGVATGKDSEKTAEKSVIDTVRGSKRVSKWDALRRGTEFIAETERRSSSGSRRRRTRELATKLDTAPTGNEKQLEPKSEVGETNSSTDIEGSVLKTIHAETGAQLVDKKTAFQLNDCRPSEQKVASSKSCDVESSMKVANSSVGPRAIDATEIAETTKTASKDEAGRVVKEAADGSSGKKRASKWGMLKGGIGFITKTKKQAELKKETGSQKIDIISEAQKHAAVFMKRPPSMRQVHVAA